MRNTSSRTSLLTLAALLLACGPSESLTEPDPDTPGDPNQPEVPGDPNPPPPATLPLRTDLGTFGGRSSFAYDVNEAGVVVGAAQNAAGDFQGFRWTSATGLQPLAPLEGDSESRAVAIADDDAVLGISIADDGATRPVIWAAGATAATELPIPRIAGAGLTPTDRNAHATVVGDADFGEDAAAFAHAWVWSAAGGFTDLADQLDVPFENYATAVNDEGVVVGILGDGPWKAYLWRPVGGARNLGVPGNAPERTEVTAQGVNGDGRVVGWTRLLPDEGDPERGPEEPFPSFDSHAYVWSEASGFTLLPGVGGNPESDAVGNDLNDRGDVVGSATPPGVGAINAVAWPRGGAAILLNGSDENTSLAFAVNNAGIAVGWTSIGGGEETNRATVWNIDQATPMMARVMGRPAPPGPLRGAAACLSLQPKLVSKAKLADCFEGRAR